MKLAIVGFGNMGRALAAGLIRSGAMDGQEIRAFARTQDRLQEDCLRLGIVAAKSNREAAQEAQMVLLCAKPYQLPHIIEEMGETLEGKLVVSVAAGLPFARLSPLLPASARLVVCIPNTPVAVCKGVFCCEANHSLTTEDQQLFEGLFSRLGRVLFLEDKALSVASTIAGCGPAFAALFMEALGDAGVKYGLERKTAYRLAAAMLEGTGALQQATGDIPAAMKDAVCSPGGTTIRGICALEANGFRHAVISAIDAVENR